ncbi:hypothetical protein [Reyranella sp.]|uniref:hypothetical protein n=1 Tax=Reyranella sp. TaxID=1929291 RepID=UPI003D09D611
MGDTSIRNLQSYRLTGSQGDLDNARTNSAQALININALATARPDQAQQLIGPMMYLLGLRLRVARELDDGAFAARAYSPDIQRTAELLNAIATSIANMPNPGPDITVTTDRIGLFTDRTTTTVYKNAPGNYWVTFETVERTLYGVVISQTERQPTWAEYVNDPIFGSGLTFGNFNGSVADAIAMGRQKAFDILGLAQIREAATQIDQLDDGIYDEGTTGNDVRNGGDLADVLLGNAGNDLLNGANGDDALRGEDGNDTLDGGAGINILRGGAGDDKLIDSAVGADVFDGGAGFDTVSFAGYPLWFVTGVTISLATGYDSYTGNQLIGIEALEGGSGADRFTGNAEANRLAGAAGNDVLEGAGGDDTLLGQQGDDALAGGDGTDMARFSDASYDPGTGVIVDLEAGTATGDGTDTLSGIEDAAGTAQGDTLHGSAAANDLLGLAGNDQLNGRAGDDVLVGGSGNDTLRGGDGNDTLYGDDISGGGDGGDRIYGDGGDDIFMLVSAGALRDRLTGGSGRDTYRLAATGVYDVVTDFKAGVGGDVIDLSFLSPLDQADAFASGLLRLVQSGTDTTELQIDTDPGAGRAYASLIVLEGVRPAEFTAINFSPAAGFVQRGWDIVGSTSGESLVGSNFGERILGVGGNDSLTGNGGNDTLDGGTGADVMTGGAGSDSYTVDNAGDKAIEKNGEGTDLVNSSVSFGLAGQYIERLTLTGSANINGTGNTLANTLTGNAGNNVLDGGAGADTMAGGAGSDTYIVDNAGDIAVEKNGGGTDLVNSSVSFDLTGQYIERLTLTGSASINASGNSLANVLTGNAANNVLDGKTGADTMTGGAGNDTYTLDNAGDVVAEKNGEGTDLVNSSVSFNLTGQYIERLTLTGSASINATGNSLANTLTGNAGNNVLDGKTGADTMAGAVGNDTYIVDNAGDIVVEKNGEGTDQVNSSVSFNLTGQYIERLTLTGSGTISGTGNSLDNALVGNAGRNFLNGGTGSDVLTGGLGADVFVFRSVLGASNIDTITDYNVAADTIQLDNAVFTAIAGTGTLSLAQFAANASGTAQDASDRIIYETDTGKLFYDSNGNAAGGAIQFAKLTAGLALTNADFSIA